MTLIEILPDYARVMDDGLYRAIDMFLKGHPLLTEQECKSLCKFIDTQKLSQEACNHVAQNDRLQLQMVVRVLYSEQLCLKNIVSGESGEGVLLSSQKLSSGIPSGAVSPRDTYASLRRENRELKLEISRVRVRLSELEKEQMLMKQGMMVKPCHGGTHGKMAPELAYSFKVTVKSDVYSFGVVLLELVTGLRPVEDEFGEGKDIVDWVFSRIQQDRRNFRKVLDKQVLSSYVEESMIRVLKMGLLCTTKLPNLRPSMREVVRKPDDADPQGFKTPNQFCSSSSCSISV